MRSFLAGEIFFLKGGGELRVSARYICSYIIPLGTRDSCSGFCEAKNPEEFLSCAINLTKEGGYMSMELLLQNVC